MLFNSFAFLVFFPLVCLVYWLLPASKRNALLLFASYYFYMNWEPAYAVLMLFTTASTWWASLALTGKTEKMRKALFWSVLVVNLSVLFLFKYANFFSENIFALLNCCGLRMQVPQFKLLLPVGISFYTFQAIGYLSDVYRQKEKALDKFSEYALFISFFPQLVAGPIERVQNMIPQFREHFTFSYSNFEKGVLMMLWGYFLKLCMADRCGLYVDAVFDNLPMHNGGSYLLALLLFTFQIYGDFCGYSMIAVGAARVMGFHMTNNFRQPYFSKSITDYWNRWHISLSSFLRDYLYIPLGGNREGKLKTYRNLMVTMLVSGLWHGANWTYVLWGGAHGAVMCVERLLGLSKKESGGAVKLLRIIVTFVVVMLFFIIFRSASVADAFVVLKGIFCNMGMPFKNWTVVTASFFTIFVVLIKDYVCEWHPNFQLNAKVAPFLKHAFVVLTVCFILLFGVLDSNQFIYFQF